jgi:hypothetical protein
MGYKTVLGAWIAADPPVHYLVGTPKGRLTRLEKHLVAQPWQEALAWMVSNQSPTHPTLLFRTRNPADALLRCGATMG